MNSSNGDNFSFTDEALNDEGNAFPKEMNPMAYIRAVRTEKGTMYGVFDTSGQQLAVFNSQDAAFYAARQHELEPALVH